MKISEVQEDFMRRSLQLASYGKGFTAPNPLVGAVVVHDGKIIGEGFHRKYGEAHAEVNAIASVKDKTILKEATIYVNLEPCSHYGKTPPCAQLIIDKQIPKVVVGQVDPFPAVSGRGIRMLKEAGVDVVCGVLEKECRELNKRFLTFTQEQRPYIILKWAQSSDGFIDRIRKVGDGQSPVKFSNPFTQMIVHKLRAEADAIMIGSHTALLDKPSLDVRFWKGKNPLRLIARSDKTIREQLNELYNNRIQSLIVEGGSKLLNSFIKEDLWDEARVEISPVILNEGVKAPVLNGALQNVQKCENSMLFHYKKLPNL